MYSQQLPVAAFALYSLLHYSNAAPSPMSKWMSFLDKRSNSLLGCDDAQTTKVIQALADMANLGNIAWNAANTGSLGYSHYFKDDEFNVFMSAMSTIAQNSDPTNGPYNFIINCSPTDDIAAQCKASKSGSYAITDATVPKDDNDIKSMWLCPLFFTGDDTKNDLPSTADADKDKLDAWCKQDNYKKFTTAGHVLLHEMTHLDAVAKLFPLEGEPEHGTTDYNQGSSPIEWARRLKIAVDNDPNRKDTPAPSFNAESYAAAATELWAMKICNLDFVPPKTGY